MADRYYCRKLRRRAQVLSAVDSKGNPLLNGIDFLEVSGANPTLLYVHFLFALPGQPEAVPASPASPLTTANFSIQGGVRIGGVKVVSVTAAANILTMTTNAEGDFSTYTLRLANGPGDGTPPMGFDPQLTSVDFSFRVGCPSDFDCRTTDVCRTERLPEPEIDYLAKDYATFRRLILDRMALTIPQWRERSPADIGVVLAELLAYAGDQLSYYQDAVATEAYLGTARRRPSVRRHARLLDYPMHDGCNSRAWVFFAAAQGPGGVIPAGTTLLTQTNRPGVMFSADQIPAALSQGSEPFETLFDVKIAPALNEIHFYTWSDDSCCLPRGATNATLVDNGASANLAAGDLLLFEEVLGPASGAVADADPGHRHIVRLTQAVPDKDPLNGTSVLEIAWADGDALPFPLCLSTVIEGDLQEIANVSVARGNLALVDHGITQAPETLPDSGDPGDQYRPQLQKAGLTFAAPYDNGQARMQPVTGALLQSPRQALPVISLLQGGTVWTARRDLLASRPNATDFVVEMENDGAATLRFGDGILGSRPPGGMTANYRTGNGSAGNVGAESIGQVVAAPGLPPIMAVRNPLPAVGGVDPESVDQVRRFAPVAFRTQERAVTEDDYAVVSRRQPEVKEARATLRWTGSWNTIFVTVDRKNGLPVDSAFRDTVRGFLERYRLAGYDLEIEAPVFVPLDIAFGVCVAPGYIRSAVEQALYDAFSTRQRPDGTKGFFYPGNFTFGQPVYLSRIVAAAMDVPGVRWVDTSFSPLGLHRFRRWGQPSQGELAAGEISMDRLEIARLDNDPNLHENGRISFVMEGGA